MATGQATWVMDVTRDSNFPRLRATSDLGVRAGFGFPVLVGANVVAVLRRFFCINRRAGGSEGLGLPIVNLAT